MINKIIYLILLACVLISCGQNHHITDHTKESSVPFNFYDFSKSENQTVLTTRINFSSVNVTNPDNHRYVHSSLYNNPNLTLTFPVVGSGGNFGFSAVPGGILTNYIAEYSLPFVVDNIVSMSLFDNFGGNMNDQDHLIGGNYNFYNNISVLLDTVPFTGSDGNTENLLTLLNPYDDIYKVSMSDIILAQGATTNSGGWGYVGVNVEHITNFEMPHLNGKINFQINSGLYLSPQGSLFGAGNITVTTADNYGSYSVLISIGGIEYSFDNTTTVLPFSYLSGSMVIDHIIINSQFDGI